MGGSKDVGSSITATIDTGPENVIEHIDESETLQSVAALYYDDISEGVDMIAVANSLATSAALYSYDALGQVLAVANPLGNADSFTYDAVGRITSATDKNGNTTRYVFDANGNIVETIDALNRLTSTDGDKGYKARTYAYDSVNNAINTIPRRVGHAFSIYICSYYMHGLCLGNLTYETYGNSKSTDYKYNNLNQLVRRIEDGKNNYTYTYDKRGNLVQEVYNKNLNNPKQDEIVASYLYDATNRMARGTNAAGEQSHYIYNGLGHLVANEWVIAKNAYGYTGVDTAPAVKVNGVALVFDSKKFSVVHKDYVLDYTSPLMNVLQETESGASGLTYRYVYGLEKLNTVIIGIPNGAGSIAQGNIVKLWYHMDRLGTTHYLTDNIAGKVTSYVSYDDWGALTSKAVIKAGARELDLVQNYTGHPADMVLGVYYAKARMYDAYDKRFRAKDILYGDIFVAISLNQYTYSMNNPIKFIDRYGMLPSIQSLVDTVTDKINSVLEMIPWDNWNDFTNDITSDIYGVELLSNWLYGNGNDFIRENDYSWSKYMTDNEYLLPQVQEIISKQILLISNDSIVCIDAIYWVEIDNGEQIIGYQYLQGTNEDAGGFHIFGTIAKNSLGEANISLTYQWNDIIDPDLSYISDQMKSQFATLLPFANPTDYKIQISWDDISTIDRFGSYITGWLAGKWKHIKNIDHNNVIAPAIPSPPPTPPPNTNSPSQQSSDSTDAPSASPKYSR